MRNEIALTDDQLEKVFSDEGYGITVEDLTFTREDIQDFRDARKNYSDPGRLLKDEGNVLVLEKVQATKNQPRKTLMVFDGGTVRAVYLG